MDDTVKQLQTIFQQLATGDFVCRMNACSDALRLIDAIQDNTKKDYIRQNIVLYLIDLERGVEAHDLITSLRSSNDLNMRIASYFDQIEYCKKIDNDNNKVEQAINECLAFTKANCVKPAEIDATMEWGKFLSKKGDVRDALTCFADVSLFAENNHNRKLLAVSKYYIGYCLYRLGHLALSESYLREATEIACQERNDSIAKHTEVLRTVVLMKQGNEEEANTVLQQWEENFALLL